MSCFGGRMQEYDRVSLDKFDSKNLQSTVYFLSHLHEDHTVGLAEKNFFKRLKSNKDIFLYCSEVTQVLLVASKKYHHLEPYIKTLDINTPTTIDIPDPLYEEKEKITVTLLPAFHCPGSVMVLIEGKEGTVLYTGDFRWEHLQIEQMHHLRSGESVKKIKSLYVDTTFCSQESLHIPSRLQCIDAVCQLVHEWTSTSPEHVVNINLRAQYGHEPLLNAVASRLNKKVHVNERKVAVYERIQELHGNFTADGASTQLHACDKDCMIEVDGKGMLCREAHDANKVLVILPTTMYFTQFLHLTLDKIVKKVGSNFFRACYSFHSSYTEVKDLLSYLKPERVYPNVKPPKDISLAVTQHRLNTMLKECLESGAGEVIQPEEGKELGTLKTRVGRQVKKRKGRESTSDTGSLDFGSPVKVARYSSSSSLKSGEQASPSESSVVTRKGRGHGTGRGKSVTETSSQPAVGTRRSTRRLATTPTPTSVETTPKKARKSERSPTPDLFQTQTSDRSDQHSSFCGSERSDTELSLFSSQKSLDMVASGEAASSWTAGSFLAAVSSSSEDDSGAGRICLLDDEEQTDEQYQDVIYLTDTEEEGEGIDTESLVSCAQPVDVCDMKGYQSAPGVAQSKGKTGSSVKKGNRGRKGKQYVQRKRSVDKTDTNCPNTDSIIESECHKDVNLQSKVVGVDELKCQSKIKMKHTDEDETENGELLVSDGIVETNEKMEETIPKVLNIALEDEDSEKTDTPKIQAAENINDRCEIQNRYEDFEDNKRLTYLGMPVKTVNRSGPGSDDSNYEITVTTEKKSTKVFDSFGEETIASICEVDIGSGTESSEELHLQLSKTTHGSEENSNESNFGGEDTKIDEILVIDSDSDDVISVEEVNNASTDIELDRDDRELESKHTELRCDEHKTTTKDEILILDSDSLEVLNSDDISFDKDKSNKEKIFGKMNDYTETIDSQQSKALVNPPCDEAIRAIEKDEIALKRWSGEVEQTSTGPVSYGLIEGNLQKSYPLQLNIDKTASQISKREKSVDTIDDNQSKQSIRSLEILEQNETKTKDEHSKLLKSKTVRRTDEGINGVNSSTQSVNEEQKILPENSEADNVGNNYVQKAEVVNDYQLGENKDSKEDEDDIIEIVDLTGDDRSGQFETQESLKHSKKTIKISLLNKPEPVKRIKKAMGSKSNENDKEKAKIEHQKSESNSDSEEEVEISSSPEWLSVKKATGKKENYEKGKAKKSQARKANRLREREIENAFVTKSNESLESSSKFSKKELEERDEVRRQALGFICETDSDSDTDESSGPDSPAADILYDDYVELTSDSDNEDGIGGRRKGGRSLGRKFNSHKGTGGVGNCSDTGRSGGSAEGWLSARKNMDQSEPAVENTTLNKDTHIDLGDDEKFSKKVRVEKVQGSVAVIQDKIINETDQGTVLHANEEDKRSKEIQLESLQESRQSLLDTRTNDHSDDFVERDACTSLKTGNISYLTNKTVQNNENTHLETREINEVIEKTTDIVNEPDENPLNTTKTTKIDNSEAHDTSENSTDVKNMKENVLTEEVNTAIAPETPNLVPIKTFGSKNQITDQTDKYLLRDITADKDTTALKARVENKVTQEMQESPTLTAGKTLLNSAENSKGSELLQDKRHTDTAGYASHSANKQTQKEAYKQLLGTSSETADSSNTKHKQDEIENEHEVGFSGSGAKSPINQANEYQQSLGREKYDDLRKFAPSNIIHSSDLEVYLDQPPPPGTEDLPVHSPQQETKRISSLISKRRSFKGYRHSTCVPVTVPPSPAISASSPLYNFVGRGTFPPNFHPSSLSTQHAAHRFPQSRPAVPTPPPGWDQYQYRAFPPYMFPPVVPHPSIPPCVPPHPDFSVHSPAFTQPPPEVSYPTAFPTTTLTSTASVISTSTVWSSKSIFPSPTGVAVASVAPSIISSKTNAQEPVATNYHSTRYVQSVTPTTMSVIPAAKTNAKKLSSPWQQKKAELLRKEPAYIAKKEFKPKITRDIGNTLSEQVHADNAWVQPESAEKRHYVDQIARLSQQDFEQKEESTDLSAIKANISALTGLSVASLKNTSTSFSKNSGVNQSEDENIPDLVEKLKKLEQMQAILQVVTVDTQSHGTSDSSDMNSGVSKQIFQYGHHSESVDYPETRKYDPYDRRQSDRDRRTTDEVFETEHRRSSHKHERRERDYNERFRSKEYYDYESRGQSHDDYERRERDFYYRKRERDVDYDRERDFDDHEHRERKYMDLSRREREFERRYREEEEYRLWLEERRRNDYYRRDVGRAPPRYSDRMYEDIYYDRPSTSRTRDQEYEEWRVQDRRNYRDQHELYERYEDYPPPRHRSPRDRLDPELAYGSQRPKRPGDNTEPYFDNFERNNYGKGESVGYGGLETNQVHGHSGDYPPNQPHSVAKKPVPLIEPFKKRPVMTRVLSRSGQLISLQSATAVQQAPATTKSEEKQENTDLPVFLTGMNYYSAPAAQ